MTVVPPRTARAPSLRQHRDRRALHALIGAFSLLLVLSPSLVVAMPAPAPQAAAEPQAVALQPSFVEDTYFSGQLTDPIAARFLPDGRVWVAQKNGIIKVFDNLSDTTPTTFADLRSQVHDFWDRGMLGFALDPGFLTGRPYVYVLYTFDAPIGGTAPTWGDACPTPPGPNGDGCVVSARLSKLTANGNVSTGPETVLINDWCQQYPSHSIGTIAFGADGFLYVSGGDGASFNFADYGQDGSPLNPCGDPPSGVGGVQSPPTAEGGALRSQDLRTPADPTSLDGSLIRVDPDSGSAAPTNPLIASPDANARRIIAHGFRNPFRFTFRPGTNELWIGDVGWNDWEEIDRIADPLGTVENFGWPCYEGVGRQPGYDSANLNVCENLYAAGSGAITSPYYTYNHSASVVAGDTCSTAGSSISGLAFYQGGSYPSAYTNALFFSDYSRDCIWVMFAGSNGLPDPSNRAIFAAQASNPVELQIGPGGDVFYADLAGSIRRIRFTGGGPPPPPPTGLAAAYAFSEGGGATTADATGGGATGTLTNGASWGAGRNGSAVQFDGVDDFVDLGNPAALQMTGSLTISAWINSSAYPGDDAGIVSKRNGSEVGYQLDTTVDKGPRTIGFKLTNSSGGQMFRYGATALQPNTWYHVAGVYDASAQTLHVYLNGQLNDGILQGTVTASQQNSTANVNIGRRPADSYLTNGRIDDVRIYNRPLAQSEIQADMNTAVGTPPGDTEAPSIPSAFTATPASQSQINLSWTASADNVGVTGYRLERCQGVSCTSFLEVATPSASPYGDTGLAAGTTYRYRIRARDAAGNNSDYSSIATAATQGVPNTAPTATIDAPANLTPFSVGETIQFSGSASDTEDGTLAASRLSWTLVQQHCPSGQACHSHTVQTFAGVASGSFVAPDHDYPSYLELTLTATDSGGMTDAKTVRLDPRTVVLTFQSNPTGLQLTVGSAASTTTFTRTVIQGSANSISAPPSQTLGGVTYTFVSWSDGGAATHNIVANASTTYLATYQATATADLRLVKTGSKSGSTATWTLAVTNLGPFAAQNVAITDALPSRLTFVSATTGCSYAAGTRVVTCSLGSLASGAGTSFNVTTTITGSAGGWISNTASVASSTSDPSTANNTSTDRVKAR